MEDFYFVCKDLYDPIEEQCIKSTNKFDEDWKKINWKTVDIIM